MTQCRLRNCADDGQILRTCSSGERALARGGRVKIRGYERARPNLLSAGPADMVDRRGGNAGFLGDQPVLFLYRRRARRRRRRGRRGPRLAPCDWSAGSRLRRPRRTGRIRRGSPAFVPLSVSRGGSTIGKLRPSRCSIAVHQDKSRPGMTNGPTLLGRCHLASWKQTQTFLQGSRRPSLPRLAHHVVAELLTLIEGAHSGALDCGDMDEYVLPALGPV